MKCIQCGGMFWPGDNAQVVNEPKFSRPPVVVIWCHLRCLGNFEELRLKTGKRFNIGNDWDKSAVGFE